MSPRVLLAGVALSAWLFASTSFAQIASRSAAEAPAMSAPEGAIVSTAPPVKNVFSAPLRLPRFEVGVQTTMLRTMGSSSGCSGCPTPQFAVGPALTVNLNRNFALDAAASFFISQSLPNENFGGWLGEALAGVKASIHGSKWSLFAKARPGVVSWSRTVQQIDLVTLPVRSAQDVRLQLGRANEFALDLGGGVEYRVGPQVALRGELGETFIRLAPVRFGGVQSGASSAVFDHSVQSSAGVYYRFGKPMVMEFLTGAPEGQHRFFDRSNVALMMMNMLAQASDAITTQRAFADCRKQYAANNIPLGGCAQLETDPIARPFVSHGWAGQIGLGAIVNSAQMVVIYGIHRMGHHRIERVVPIPMTIASGYLGYSNLQKK